MIISITWHTLSISQNLYKQVLKGSCQWRYLQNRMQSGLGHQQEDESPSDGSMAIFCPACPQPGIHLPEDWKTKYTLYGFSKFIGACMLTLPKEATHSHLYNGWQCLCRTYEMQNRSSRCATFCRNGFHGQSRLIQGSPQQWTRNHSGICILLM